MNMTSRNTVDLIIFLLFALFCLTGSITGSIFFAVFSLAILIEEQAKYIVENLKK